MSLGERIKRARKYKGFTLKELGELVGVTHSALSRIENDKNEVSKKTLIALARTLGDDFELDWLRDHIERSERPVSKREMVKSMSAREFVSIKFGGRQSRRSKAEAEMLAKLLDAELERMKQEGW